MQLFPCSKLLSRAGAGIYIKIIACPCPELGDLESGREIDGVGFGFLRPILKDCFACTLFKSKCSRLAAPIFTHAVRIDIDESPFSQDANMDKYIQLIRDEDVATKGAVLKTFGAIFENRRPAGGRQQYKKEQAMINSDVGGSAFNCYARKSMMFHATIQKPSRLLILWVMYANYGSKINYICNEIFTEPFKRICGHIQRFDTYGL